MNKIIKITILFLTILAVLTQGIGIYISNTKSLESLEATKLRVKIDELREENINLQSEVLASSSFSAISSRAGELGYRDTREFVSVYDPLELAQKR